MADRRPLSESIFFYLSLVVLFAGLTALTLFLLAGERRRGALLAQYETERLASALMESFRGGEELGLEDLRGRVLGFGVYSASGRALQRVGTAPEQLPELPRERAGRPLPRFQRGSRSLLLVRRLGMGPGMMEGMHGRMHGMMGRRQPWGEGNPQLPSGPRPGGRPEGAPEYVFLELEAAGFWGRERAFRLAQATVPAVLLGIAALLVFLYRRNHEYRRRLEAQSELARLGEVSRTLSHEIKNPLSAIRLQTGILRRTLPEERRADLRVIEEEVQRLSLLTDRVGDFLRDPRGQPQSLDLDGFLRELTLRYDRRVRYAPQGGEAVRVLADPQRLRSVMENLINNALESREGEGEVEVRCGAARGRAEVAVLDRGPGIPPELLEQVFDPFYTTKTKGSGIGLAIARRFVEAAGGQLTLANRPGGGIAARVLLPRETAP